MKFFFKGSDNFVGNSLNKTWEQLKSNKHFATAVKGSSGPLPVLTTYPTTDASKVGQKFIYNGAEWSYMSKAEIDALGWPVSKGFPAPVNKLYDILTFYPDGHDLFTMDTSLYLIRMDPFTSYVGAFDVLGYGKSANKLQKVQISGLLSGTTFTSIKNVQLLQSLKDIGTELAVDLRGNLTAELIDQFFTDLPSTTKTATIRVNTNPGAATCDPTIATAKGYTVVT
jgi:hypothetical protein